MMVEQHQERMMNDMERVYWKEYSKRPKSWMWMCSKCEKIAYFMPKVKDGRKVCGYKYCPNCGARMED